MPNVYPGHSKSRSFKRENSSEIIPLITHEIVHLTFLGPQNYFSPEIMEIPGHFSWLSLAAPLCFISPNTIPWTLTCSIHLDSSSAERKFFSRVNLLGHATFVSFRKLVFTCWTSWSWNGCEYNCTVNVKATHHWIYLVKYENLNRYLPILIDNSCRRANEHEMNRLTSTLTTTIRLDDSILAPWNRSLQKFYSLS